MKYARHFFRRVYDEDIARAVKYFKSLNACQTNADRDRLGQRMPRLPVFSRTWNATL